MRDLGEQLLFPIYKMHKLCFTGNFIAQETLFNRLMNHNKKEYENDYI